MRTFVSPIDTFIMFWGNSSESESEDLREIWKKASVALDPLTKEVYPKKI